MYSLLSGVRYQCLYSRMNKQSAVWGRLRRPGALKKEGAREEEETSKETLQDSLFDIL